MNENYNRYNLVCEECGNKTSVWRNSFPGERTPQEDLDTFKRNINEVTLPAHLGHKFYFKNIQLGLTEEEFNNTLDT